jgi:carbonic anhydrase
MTALRRLIDGFADFRAGFWAENAALFERLGREGQSPKVFIIGCSDARVDPGILTRTQPGDLFTVRNVGAIVPPDQPDAEGYHGTSTALEFAVVGLEVEHIVVLGHALCGGMAALMEEGASHLAKYEYLADWMNIVRQARDMVNLGLPEATDAERRRAVEQAGVIVSVGNVMSFPWVRERVQAGKLSVHGWYYDLRTSELHAFNPVDATFHRLHGHDGIEMPSVVANADDATAENDRRLTRFVEAQRQRLIVAKAPIG